MKKGTMNAIMKANRVGPQKLGKNFSVPWSFLPRGATGTHRDGRVQGLRRGGNAQADRLRARRPDGKEWGDESYHAVVDGSSGPIGLRRLGGVSSP